MWVKEFILGTRLVECFGGMPTCILGHDYPTLASGTKNFKVLNMYHIRIIDTLID